MAKEENKQQLGRLLESAIPENIQLALTLNKAHKFDFDLSPYMDCYEYLVETAQIEVGLTDMMEILVAFGRITELYIKGKGVDTIGKAASFFAAVEELDFVDLEIETVPSWVFNFPNLYILHFANVSITSLSHELGKLSKLQVLSIYDCKVETLPDIFDQLPHLKHIYLHENALTSIPASIYSLTQLERLDISYNPLTNLSEDIGKLQQLEILYIKGTEITDLPKTLLQLPKLKGVMVGGNHFSMIENFWVEDDLKAHFEQQD